jgi:hypothetical protein
MGLYIILALYTGCFALLAWHNFRYAIGFFIIALPTYLIRFQIGPIPSTVLEVMWLVLVGVWVLRYARADKQKIIYFITQHGVFCIAIMILLVTSLLSCFVGDTIIKSLGIWRAYFLEPVIIFFIFLARSKFTTEPVVSATDSVSRNDLVWFLGLATLSSSLYGIVQKFTGWGIATIWWTNIETRRVTAFFTSPNAIGLFSVPIIVLAVGQVIVWVKKRKKFTTETKSLTLRFRGILLDPFKKFSQERFSYLCLVSWCSIAILSSITIVFAKSDGSVVALAVGIGTLLFLVGYKKLVFFIVGLSLILSLSSTSIKNVLLFQDRAGQNRLLLMAYSWDYLKESPEHFVLGAGLRQFFERVQKPRNDFLVMEPLIYPHNIVFNFWTEIGLVGMLSFFVICGYAFFWAWSIQKQELLWGAVLISMLSALMVHGLVDVPYFKNDLAMLFWIVLCLFFIPTTILKKQTTAFKRSKERDGVSVFSKQRRLW